MCIRDRPSPYPDVNFLLETVYVDGGTGKASYIPTAGIYFQPDHVYNNHNTFEHMKYPDGNFHDFECKPRTEQGSATDTYLRELMVMKAGYVTGDIRLVGAV